MSSDGGSGYKPAKWSFGILNPKSTDEVPGSVLLLPKPYNHNEPLGLQNTAERTSSSNFPPVPYHRRSLSTEQSRPQDQPREGTEFNFNVDKQPTDTQDSPSKKRSSKGIILDPQPEDSQNDPLNWQKWRRDLALLSLGFYCFIGGGMTPVLAAGFSDVADTYNIDISEVALTTGLFMLGLGFGGVFASPTAILYGKRPVYIVGAILFVISAVWCAVSPNYPSLVVARIFQGIALSPCEALPSATIAEIYFLHERAYRLGIYTLLLLGGKNLMPLISAAIIGNLGWRWVFWIVGIMGGLGGILLFLFVPETFWDRTPVPKVHHNTFSASLRNVIGHVFTPGGTKQTKEQVHQAAAIANEKQDMPLAPLDPSQESGGDRHSAIVNDSATSEKLTIAERRKTRMVGFAQEPMKSSQVSDDPMAKITIDHTNSPANTGPQSAVGEIYGAKTPKTARMPHGNFGEDDEDLQPHKSDTQHLAISTHRDEWRVQPHGQALAPKTPDLRNFNSPTYDQEDSSTPTTSDKPQAITDNEDSEARIQRSVSVHSTTAVATPFHITYTEHHRNAAPRSFTASMKPWNGRLRKEESWMKAAIRPFILYLYPSILWSSLVYALSVGWLIVLSESVSLVYRSRNSYHFTAMQCGLVYLSPFIGGVLGTAVAGKISDIIVRWMARRNDGVYEPEFRLVMAGPILISTVAGLMGFGWAAQERDAWIVPTVLFGVISFGCSLGSTTAITFAVDSYRQYASEALVNLNFSKNVLHGFIFSLFITGWLESAGSKTVFLAIGGIQTFCLLLSIPMFLYGKRARFATTQWKMLQRW